MQLGAPTSVRCSLSSSILRICTAAQLFPFLPHATGLHSLDVWSDLPQAPDVITLDSNCVWSRPPVSLAHFPVSRAGRRSSRRTRQGSSLASPDCFRSSTRRRDAPDAARRATARRWRVMACHAMIKACSVDGSIYFGFFLTPVAAPPAIAAASLLELTHGFVVNDRRLRHGWKPRILRPRLYLLAGPLHAERAAATASPAHRRCLPCCLMRCLPRRSI